MEIGGLAGILIGCIIGQLFALLIPSLNWFLGAVILFIGGVTFFVLFNKYFTFRTKIQFLKKNIHPVLWYCVAIFIFLVEQIIFDKINF
ncbi:hypothetical protein PU629_16325 [Pullulanibacillus sp. KACC 23026]|uniref:hypothetical protein n=1 Tax=Pullulanibacillus sp. KACC 23026 TaxID=3028315 RepID=UPI0023B189EC|nr:hypothetical protein [Pullulanibacillus sp. KACC 23026]WEG11699.1 hypothetical protein PU629_16325 [Pullulanibacillus sp. KACC 23026]